jgi:hypothetical protein
MRSPGLRVTRDTNSEGPHYLYNSKKSTIGQAGIRPKTSAIFWPISAGDATT